MVDIKQHSPSAAVTMIQCTAYLVHSITYKVIEEPIRQLYHIYA